MIPSGPTEREASAVTPTADPTTDHTPSSSVVDEHTRPYVPAQDVERMGAAPKHDPPAVSVPGYEAEAEARSRAGGCYGPAVRPGSGGFAQGAAVRRPRTPRHPRSTANSPPPDLRRSVGLREICQGPEARSRLHPTAATSLTQEPRPGAGRLPPHPNCPVRRGRRQRRPAPTWGRSGASCRRAPRCPCRIVVVLSSDWR